MDDKAKFKFYTDGTKTIKLKADDPIPDGFKPGRTFKVNPWNKGLTAETDSRVANNTANMRNTRIQNDSYHSWNKGLTKETNDSLMAVSKKVSAAKKGQEPWNKGVPVTPERKAKQSAAMQGRTPWNKGLTKETNASLQRASEKLKGHECFVTDWEAAKAKEYQTKKQNNSFNSSKIEAKLIDELISEYGEEDVLHPYRDSRYPFNCDIYIKSIDLFIEVNGTIEHNRRPFDPNNPEHLAEAVELEDRARAKGDKSRYWNILKWWTEIDPLKLKTFRDNNLNFRIIYPDNLIIEK